MGTGEHLQGRPLLTPDEVMRFGPTRPIVLVSGEPPYLLQRVSYLTDPAYGGRSMPTLCTCPMLPSEVSRGFATPKFLYGLA